MSTEARASVGGPAETPFTARPFPVVRTARLDAVEEQARTRGHAAGYADGTRRAAAVAAALRARQVAEHEALLRSTQARTDTLLAALGAAVQALEARTAPTVAAAQDALATAALELATAVVGQELGDMATAVRSALGRALSVDADQVVAVRLSPGDLTALTDEQRAAAGVRLVADPDLASGDAVAVFDDGHLDARVGTALARARAALTGTPS
ncbi:FliH/SctL family protein [Georgenia sp. AZ-5]|uniref:FliH/SctL family protein n=1 Tax=Georgenia sp. AZ-5 TaxID=3367526 RepID=UPI003753F423